MKNLYIKPYHLKKKDKFMSFDMHTNLYLKSTRLR